jgi:hypothetical protein
MYEEDDLNTGGLPTLPIAAIPCDVKAFGDPSGVLSRQGRCKGMSRVLNRG